MTLYRQELQPTPGWGELEQALAAATGATEQALGARAAHAIQTLLPEQHGGLRSLQLFDLLWCEHLEPSAAARVARRRLVFEQLVAPLVREAPVRKLEPQEKALLIKACQATAGSDGVCGEEKAVRKGHREAFDELLHATMAQFVEQLRAEYGALAAQPGGAALLALPATELLHDTAEGGLRQDAAAVGGAAPWLGDLAGAYRCALVPSGMLDSPGALCDLLQDGRHRLLKEPRPTHFNHKAESVDFWRHVCALQSVARHEPLNAEFHAHIKKKLDGVQGACFKDAPLKGYDRVAVKTAAYHAKMGLPDTPAGAGAAAARVIDIVRCSFEVPSAQSALALCAWLDAAKLEEHGVRALRRKNGFHADAETAGGYRDIKYNLLYQSLTVAGAMGRAIVEVQIIVQAYLKVKKKMHAVYRIHRGDFG
jgi:hypothetical protein